MAIPNRLEFSSYIQIKIHFMCCITQSIQHFYYFMWYKTVTSIVLFSPPVPFRIHIQCHLFYCNRYLTVAKPNAYSTYYGKSYCTNIRLRTPRFFYTVKRKSLQKHSVKKTIPTHFLFISMNLGVLLSSRIVVSNFYYSGSCNETVFGVRS